MSANSVALNMTVPSLFNGMFIDTSLCNHRYATLLTIHGVSIKTFHFYFLKNFVKHWPTLIIFGTLYYKET